MPRAIVDAHAQSGSARKPSSSRLMAAAASMAANVEQHSQLCGVQSELLRKRATLSEHAAQGAAAARDAQKSQERTPDMSARADLPRPPAS